MDHLIKRILHAVKMADSLSGFAFFLGYDRIVLPRQVRYMLSRSEFHRAWLRGYTGSWLFNIDERSEPNVELCDCCRKPHAVSEMWDVSLVGSVDENLVCEVGFHRIEHETPSELLPLLYDLVDSDQTGR